MKTMRSDTSTAGIGPTRGVPVRIILAIAVTAGALTIPTLARAAPRYPARLRPAHAYFGAVTRSVTQLEHSLGRRLAVDHQYYRWNSAIPTAHQEWDRTTGHIPFLNWTALRTDGGATSWASIARGTQDPWIRERARAFKRFKKPVYLTFNHEPENDLARFGSPQDFAAAFRHIVRVFRQQHVHNVAFVWTMMSWTFDPSNRSELMDYYPGDAYVDFIGSDGYDWYGVRPGDPWRSFSYIFKSTHAFARHRGKPWIAAEYAAVEDPAVSGRKARWIHGVLPTVRAWRNLKAILYFDIVKNGNHWATDSSAASIRAFRSLATDPYFGLAKR
jgi:hypothetical protein